MIAPGRGEDDRPAGAQGPQVGAQRLDLVGRLYED
jgi:hypothetical protein